MNDPTNCPDGEIDCSFIRRGFPYGTTLDLTFDPERQYENQARSRPAARSAAPTFTDTLLLPIPPLAHDQLGLYEFPGGGRIRNYMFVASPETGPLAGRDAMVFLSLIRGGNIEVRIIAGPGLIYDEEIRDICYPADCTNINDGQCDYFGVFALHREQL